MSSGGKQTQKGESGFTKSQEAFIRSEITSQLLAMKTQIDIELAQDMQNLEKRLLAAIGNAVAATEQKTTANIDAVKREVDTKVASAKNQIVLANSNQLATVNEQTKQLIQVAGQQIVNAAYKKVIGEINRDIVPKVNNMIEYVNYQMQDGGEVVTDYRRSVHEQANGGMKAITDGDNRHIISENVSLFFREGE